MKKTILLMLAVLAGMATFLQAQDAVFRPGDSFELRISGVPSDRSASISGNYTIDGQGFFNLTHIGKVRAGGRTPSEVQATVERAYVDQGFFTHPTIALTMAQTPRFVNIGGPGIAGGGKRLAYTSDLTVLSAITAAGDFNEFADQRKVRLIRAGKVQIIDCKKLRQDPSKDINVLPGDNIQVPETLF